MIMSPKSKKTADALASQIVTIAVRDPKTKIEHLAEVSGGLLTQIHSGDPLPAGSKTIDGLDAAGFIWTGRNFTR
jgi:hypothetical protein